MRPKISPRSKYYKDWVRANGGPPKRGQEMSPAVLVNPEIGYTVHVGDAVKDSEGAVKDDALVYSRIDKILDSEAPKRPRGHAGKLASRFTLLSLEAFNPSSAEACTQQSVCWQAGFTFRRKPLIVQAVQRASR